MLNQSAIANILHSVGSLHKSGRVDIAQLQTDLNGDLDRYFGYVHLDSSARKKAFRNLVRFEAALRRVNLVDLAGDPYFIDAMSRAARSANLSDIGIGVGALPTSTAIQELDEEAQQYEIAGFKEVIVTSERRFTENSDQAVQNAMRGLALLKEWARIAAKVAPKKTQISPISRLVGHMLPETYEKHFDEEFYIRRSGAIPVGPAVQFVLAVFLEGGVRSGSGTPYSAASIEKYWKLARTGTYRRLQKDKPV